MSHLMPESDAPDHSGLQTSCPGFQCTVVLTQVHQPEHALTIDGTRIVTSCQTGADVRSSRCCKLPSSAAATGALVLCTCAQSYRIIDCILHISHLLKLRCSGHTPAMVRRPRRCPCKRPVLSCISPCEQVPEICRAVAGHAISSVCSSLLPPVVICVI
jgi:hypothetical protein